MVIFQATMMPNLRAVPNIDAIVFIMPLINKMW